MPDGARGGLTKLVAASLLGLVLAVAWARPTLRLRTGAFRPNGPIPARYTCHGVGTSPALRWSAVPAGTRSLALVVEDPDAPSGIWVHWVIYNIPAHTRSLPSGVPHRPRLSDGACQGLNDFGKIGYDGPCPPPGRVHHYHFRLFALDCKLPLGPGVTPSRLLRAIKGHVLAEGLLVGTYRR